MNTLEEKRKKLKVIGYVLIAMAVCNVFSPLADVLTNDYSAMLKENNVSQSVFYGLVAAMIINAAILSIVELYFGIKGVLQADGKLKKQGHIKAALVIIIILCVIFVISIISSIMVKDYNIKALISDLVVILTLIIYRKAALDLAKEN